MQRSLFFPTYRSLGVRQHSRLWHSEQRITIFFPSSTTNNAFSRQDHKTFATAASVESTANILRQLAQRNTGVIRPQTKISVSPSSPPSLPLSSSLSSTTKTKTSSSTDPRGIAASVLQQSTAASSLRQYMAHRRTFDFLSCSLVLARLASIWNATTPTTTKLSSQQRQQEEEEEKEKKAELLNGEAITTLLQDTYSHLRDLISNNTAIDPRVLASTLHSVAKLSTTVLSSTTTTSSPSPPTTNNTNNTNNTCKTISRNPEVSEAVITLSLALQECCIRRIDSMPPRSLAMTAWSLSKLLHTESSALLLPQAFYDNIHTTNTKSSSSLSPSHLYREAQQETERLFLHISELSVEGKVCRTWPPYVPSQSAIISSSSSFANQPEDEFEEGIMEEGQSSETRKKSKKKSNSSAYTATTGNSKQNRNSQKIPAKARIELISKYKSPFEPPELSMLATAFATAGVMQNPSVHARLLRYAEPLLQYFPHPGFISLAWAFASTIPSAAAATAGSSSSNDEVGPANISSEKNLLSASNQTGEQPVLLADNVRGADFTTIAAATKNDGNANSHHEAKLRALFLLADEMAVRFTFASTRMKQQQKYQQPHNDSLIHVDMTTADGTEVERKQLAAIAMTRAAARDKSRDGDEEAEMLSSGSERSITSSAAAEADVSPSNLTASHRFAMMGTDAGTTTTTATTTLQRQPQSPTTTFVSERNQPFTPRMVATILHAFSSGGLRAPHLLNAAAMYLTTAFPLSIASSSSSSSSSPAAASSSSSSLYFDSESLASIAWAFARTRYESQASSGMWKILQTEAAARTNQLVTSKSSSSSPSSSPSMSAPLLPLSKHQRTKPSHVATWCWAASSASVPAAPVLQAALHHAGNHTASYTVPALAQILWASALQWEYDGEAFKSIFEHILSLAEHYSQGAPSGNRRASSSSSHNPDAIAAQLLPSAKELSSTSPTRTHYGGVGKLQAQLYTALLGIHLDAPQKLAIPQFQLLSSSTSSSPSSSSLLSLVLPENVLSHWKSSLLRYDPRPSKLQADVSRVLSIARLSHVQEHATPEGLLVDILMAPTVRLRNDTKSLSLSSFPKHHHQQQQRQMKIALEVQGPSHFLGGIDIAQTMIRDASGSVSFKPSDMMLSRAMAADALPLDAVVTTGNVSGNRSNNIHRLDAQDGHTSSSSSSLFLPTLRTTSKLRWLEASGYKIVTVSFAEWAEAPSTQEKLELLYEKGLPVSEKLLSWG